MVLKFTGLRKLVEALRYISLMVSLEVLPLTDAKNLDIEQKLYYYQSHLQIPSIAIGLVSHLRNP